MKVVILAGGLGSRLAEETSVRPKPMVEIGGMPILCHILNTYAHFGYNEFIIAAGYKSEVFKEYFYNYLMHHSDMVVKLREGKISFENIAVPDWELHIADTGVKTQTGGRLFKLKHLLTETLMVTYGDGVGNVNIDELVRFHRSHGKLGTVTAVHPLPRFGNLEVEGSAVKKFSEKPLQQGLINGGFFVFEPAVFEFLGQDVPLEREPLERIAASGQLMAFLHTGFWHQMDTVHDRQALQALCDSGNPPWNVWQ